MHEDQELADLGQRMQAVRAEERALSGPLAEAIRRADQRGMPQVEIMRLTGYTRETIRRIIDPSKAERANAARRKTKRAA